MIREMRLDMIMLLLEMMGKMCSWNSIFSNGFTTIHSIASIYDPRISEEDAYQQLNFKRWMLLDEWVTYSNYLLIFTSWDWRRYAILIAWKKLNAALLILHVLLSLHWKMFQWYERCATNYFFVFVDFSANAFTMRLSLCSTSYHWAITTHSGCRPYTLGFIRIIYNYVLGAEKASNLRLKLFYITEIYPPLR